MDPGSVARPRVPDRQGSSLRTAGGCPGAGRRRPAGEPPPLPRRIGKTGWWWLRLGTLAIIGWVIAAAGGALLPVDQAVLGVVARERTPALTRVMPRPIAIQRFNPRRIGLTLAVLAGAFIAIGLVVSNLDVLGLVPS